MKGQLEDEDFMLVFQFQYKADTAHLNVPFKIYWGSTQRKALDNPDRIQGKLCDSSSQREVKSVKG